MNGVDWTGIDLPGVWSASPVPGGACGPNAFSTTDPLHGTRDAPLFTGEAWGNPAVCAVGGGALAKGTYRVKLYFAEIYFGDGCAGAGGVGSRVFDIVIEGTTYLKDFDILAQSGSACLASSTTDAGAPVMRVFDVPVTDGTLDIALPATQNEGKISALEVFGPL